MTGPAIVRPANSDFWKAFLVFIMAIVRDSLWPKKLFDGRGLFGGKIKERISLTRKSAKNGAPPTAKKKNRY